MNYLKKFESFQTHDEIHQICEEYNIKKYTINSDGSIDVNWDVDLRKKNLKKLPLKFNKVSGNFDCSDNEITTLEDSPKYVSGYFKCSGNELTTLEGAPQSVGGNFWCNDNRLTTLEGAPQSVYIFYCYENKHLKSLEYLPKYIGRNYVDFKNTAIYEIFELLGDFSLEMIRYVNDFKVVVDGKINIEMLNAILYDQGKPLVKNVKGYINI